MNKKDTVVFDLDGTLLDTLEDLKNSVNYAMTQCVYPEHTLDEVRRYVGNGILNAESHSRRKRRSKL